MLWIAALLLVAYAAVRVVRTAPRRESRPGPGYTCVEYANPRGWGTVRRWVKDTEPDHYPVDGASNLTPYVERAFASPFSFVTLSFFSPDGDRGSSLRRVRGEFSVQSSFRSLEDRESEDRARTLFAARGIAPLEDSLEGDGWRSLSWSIHGDAEAVASLCRAIVRDVWRVRDDEPLDITYEEREFEEP